MKTVEVVVQSDHLQALARAKDPVAALSELVWNAVDADADEVRVSLIGNDLDGLERIVVSDNGHGLRFADGLDAFRNLGGSTKRVRRKSPAGRLQHGKLGRGRFRAFALGSLVEWRSRFADDGHLQSYQITGRLETLGRFEFTEPVVTTGKPGVDVEISNLNRKFVSLGQPRARETVAREFALYLRQYPSVSIYFDGSRIDPSAVEDHLEDIDLGEIEVEPGRKERATLTLIEWSIPQERALFLCDENGFSLAICQPRIHASGYQFTGYLRSSYLREQDEAGLLVLEENVPGIEKLLEAARVAMREYFRRRSSEEASELVEAWKSEDIYPYVGAPETTLEQIERQVFDIVAVNVQSYLPDFDEADVQSKRLSFRLLKAALETDPGSLQTILFSVLDLPREKRDDLARLLQKTTFEAIVGAAKMVADRLDFLKGLSALVFDPSLKKQVKERSQLHRIVAENAWLFGESYNISADDEDLTTVLRRNLDEKRYDIAALEPVRREDGRKAVVDLVLGRLIPQSRGEEREHLVVELKRPSVKIDGAALDQIKSYAVAIASDARFRDTKTRWDFWVVSGEMTESARFDANQENLPPGLVSRPKGKGYTVWARTWGELIQESEARMRFVQERLRYRADAVSGMDHMQALYEKYIPKSARVRAKAGLSRDQGAVRLLGSSDPGGAENRPSVETTPGQR